MWLSMPVYRRDASSYRRNANTAWFICSVLNTFRLTKQVKVFYRKAGDGQE